MSKWISVEDRLPEENQKVKMLMPDYGNGSGGLEDDGVFHSGHFDDYIGMLNNDIVSHWQPLSKEANNE